MENAKPVAVDDVERSLARRFLEGDQEAFWTLLVRNLKVIDGVLAGFRYFRDHPVEKEKAAMDAADRAWEKRDQFLGKGKFRGWLSKLAVSVARNRVPTDDPTKHRTKRTDVVSLDDRERFPSIPAPPVGIDSETAVLVREVYDELNSLETHERLSVTLFYHERLTDREIAGVLEIDEARIAGYRHRAIVKIRRRLCGANEATP